MEHRSYRCMDEEDSEAREAGAGATAGSGRNRDSYGSSNKLQQSDDAFDNMSHPLLDHMADKILDCLPRLSRTWLPVPLPNTAVPSGIQMTSPTNPHRLQAPRKSSLHP